MMVSTSSTTEVGSTTGDRARRDPTTEYYVPVDPMDDLQCESCQ
jgi:hypothetical protein